MRNHWIIRAMAMLLVLLLALPCVAVAEDEIVVTESVDDQIVVEGEIALEEGSDAPTEAVEVAELPVEVFDEATEADDSIEDIETIEAFEAIEAAGEVESDGEDLPEETSTLLEAADADDEIVVADSGVENIAMKKAANPNAPTSVAIDTSKGRDFYVGMGTTQLNAVLQPPTAQTSLKWKSSKKKIVKVDKNGVITPRKAGKAKITVTTGNKKKSSIRVTVHKNLVNNINPKPTRATLAASGRSWDFFPKSVERTASGKYVCKFYLINNLGRAKKIYNLGFKMYIGDTMVAQKVWPKIKVSGTRGKAKVFKIAFKPAELTVNTPMLLPQYGAQKIRFELTTNPSLLYSVRR